MYLCVWFAEVFNGITLELVVVLVTNADEVVPLLRELLR